MENMFDKCSSLTNLNLSSFNTQKVTKMNFMFCNCSSLINLDLSNFNTPDDTDMHMMFFKCSSLKMEKIITKDERVFDQYLNDKNDD